MMALARRLRGVLVMLGLIALLALPHGALAQSAPIRVEKLVSYTYKHAFRLKVPQNWKHTEEVGANGVIVTFVDESGLGLLVLHVDDTSGTLTRPEIVELLAIESLLNGERFTPRRFVHASEPTPALAVSWSAVPPDSDPTLPEVQGRTYARQKGSRIAMLSFGAPEKQFGRLNKPLRRIFGSLTLLDGPLR